MVSPFSILQCIFRTGLVSGLLFLNVMGQARYLFGADIAAIVQTSAASSTWPSFTYRAPGGRVVPTSTGEEFGEFPGIAKASLITRVVADPIASIALKSVTPGSPHRAIQTGTPTTVLGDLYLADDRPIMAAEAAQFLASTAVLLDRDPRIRLTMEAYCDDRETEAYSFVIGQEWLLSVEHRLKSMRVKEERMSVISYGIHQPSCRERSTICWEENLRMNWSIRLLSPVMSQQGCLIRLRLAGGPLISNSTLLADNQIYLRRIEQGEPSGIPRPSSFHIR